MTHRHIELSQMAAQLFEYGESRGISSAYRAIATATSENANNIRKIHRTENTNPGLRMLTALTSYFEVDLAYFNCETRSECERYLVEYANKRLTEQICVGAQDLSEMGRDFLIMCFDYARKAEGLPPIGN